MISTSSRIRMISISIIVIATPHSSNLRRLCGSFTTNSSTATATAAAAAAAARVNPTLTLNP